ncbi:MAG: T9SS type A sorting domain-containing protein [Saprospiraceae bacterium]|nr:T9SS type A sorting domain-containing protein [Saprospiraceae bacterium]
MGNFVTGAGNSCATIISSTNAAPIVTDPSDVTIPKSTPFVLTVNATDANPEDVLTYCWEQFDNEVGNMPPQAANTVGPLFRSLNPVNSNSRYFINLPDLAAGNNPTWEKLPSVARAMEFRVTVRDNNSNYGCTEEQNINVTVADVGPFLVTSPNTNVSFSEQQNITVTWNVAQTNLAPVSCNTVDIFLSKDGGLSFPTLLVSDVPNNGSANVIVPNGASTTARIMVKCASSVFFDISNSNFTILSGTPTYELSSQPTTQQYCESGANLDYTITVSSIGDYNSPVTLTASNLPSGVTASFLPSDVVTPGNNATLQLSGLTNIAAGNYTIEIVGNSDVGVKNTSVELVAIAPFPTVLTAPVNNAVDVANIPTFDWQATTNVISYDIQVANDQDFTNIIASANVFAPTWLSSITLDVNTVYYWRVRHVRTCGNDPWSVTFSFTTNAIVTNTFQSTDVPKTISSGPPSTTTSMLTITDVGTITDIDVVNLKGTHTYINDLTFTLVSPTGTEVILLDDICGSQNNFDIQFNDQATNLYANIPCPPLDNDEYQPLNSLSVFNGKQLSGTWMLKVRDNSNRDGGSLTTWGLRATYSFTELVTACDEPLFINCGDSVSDNTNTGINFFEEHDSGIFDWTGPELVYQFITDDAAVTIDVTGLSADLDLYLLSACSDPANTAIAISENSNTNSEQINIELAAGIYYIMIDGFEGASSAFNLSLSCSLLNNPCPSLLDINDNPIATNTYTASDTISSTGSVAINSTVTFQAGELIRLLPGFNAVNGSTFTAQIQPCNSTIINPVENRTLEKKITENTIRVFPNPFTTETTIDLALSEKQQVTVQLLDMNGRLVKTICSSQLLEAGAHQLVYQADVEAGIYFLSTQIGTTLQTHKLVVIK